MTPDELAVTIEALREYRLRCDLPRRVVIDPLIINLIVELGGASASEPDTAA